MSIALRAYIKAYLFNHTNGSLTYIKNLEILVSFSNQCLRNVPSKEWEQNFQKWERYYRINVSKEHKHFKKRRYLIFGNTNP